MSFTHNISKTNETEPHHMNIYPTQKYCARHLLQAALAAVGLAITTAPVFGQVINEDQKLLAVDGAAGDEFGRSVAIGSGVVVVGAYLDDDSGSGSGSVYLFSAVTGTQLAKLLPGDGVSWDYAGISVAIDSGVVAVGAMGDDDNGPGSGSAYLFMASTGAQLAKLLPSDGAFLDQFGVSIAIDNGIVAVGANQNGTNGASSGSVYLFDASTGIQTIKLLPDDGVAGDHFGTSVAISNGIVVVGAPFGNSGAGCAYIFNASTGVQLAKLVPSDGAAGDEFGTSIAIQNSIVAVGAYRDDVFGTDSGSAYLFDASTGTQLSKLLPGDGASFDYFGHSIAIDNSIIAIGSHLDDDNGYMSGAAYLFDISSGVQLSKLLPSDGVMGDRFGISVAIDNGNVAVGAFYDDDQGADSGSAYVFDGYAQPNGPCDYIAGAVSLPNTIYNFGDQLTLTATVCVNNLIACTDPYDVEFRLVGNDPDEGFVTNPLTTVTITPDGNLCQVFDVPITLPVQESLSPGTYHIEMGIHSLTDSNPLNNIVNTPIEMTTTGAGAVTILFHGLKPTGSGWSGDGDPVSDYWNNGRDFTGSILREHGPGRVFEHVPTAIGAADDPVFVERLEVSVVPVGYLGDGSGHTIIVDNWLGASNDAHAGETESAAERIFAAMVHEGYLDLANPDSSVKMHVIGHSRGASVASEFVQRCGVYGIDVSYVTYLDPHDFDEEDIIIDGTFKDPAPQFWSNMKYADCFFQVCGLNRPLIPSGRSLASLITAFPFQINLSDRTDMDCVTNTSISNSPHSLVIDWYLTTINGVIPPNRNDWDFGYVNPDVGFRFWKNQTGFAWQNAGAVGRYNQIDPVTLVGIQEYWRNASTYDETENHQSTEFFAGDFELDDLDGNEIAGWWYPYTNDNFNVNQVNLVSLGGNTVLEYNRYPQIYGSTPLIHNPLLIPPTAQTMTFRYGVDNPGGVSSKVKITLSNSSTVSQAFYLNSSDASPLLPNSIPIPPEFQGTMTQIKFEFVDTSQSKGETVYFDDFGFDEVLGLPVTADLTGDGNVDFFDVSAFLTAFKIRDPAADFTDDGVFDFFDVSAFLLVFAEESP